MLVMALALSLAPAPVVPDSAVADEIVVTAERARKFRFRVGVNRKTQRPVCQIQRSSGDKLLDGGLCESALACIPAGLEARGRPSKALLDQVSTCVEAGSKAVVAARAAERARATRR